MGSATAPAALTSRSEKGEFAVDAWIPITNAREAESFLERTRGLHDSVLRSAVLMSRGYVTTSRELFGETAPYDVTLIFHTQQPDLPGVELRCVAVEDLRLERAIEPTPSIVIEGGQVLLRLNEPAFGEGSFVRMVSLSYKLLDEGVLTPAPK